MANCDECKGVTYRTHHASKRGWLCDSCYSVPSEKEVLPVGETIESIRPKRAKAIAFSKLSKVKKKYARFELPKDVIKATQAMRPTVTHRDTPKQRDLDDADKFKNGQRARVFVGADGAMRGFRESVVRRKATSVLGTSHFNIISDNGVEVIVERAN